MTAESLLRQFVTDPETDRLRDYPDPRTEAAALHRWAVRMAVPVVEVEQLVQVTPHQAAWLRQVAQGDRRLTRGVERALDFRAAVWLHYQAQGQRAA